MSKVSEWWGVVWILFLSFTNQQFLGETVSHWIPPRVVVPYLTRAPKIDGKLDKGEWDNTSTVLGLWGMQGELSPLQAKFYIGYDNRNLYIGFESAYSGGWLKTNVKKRDGPVWKDDSIEIFLKPELKKKRVFQFIGNSKGVFHDRMNNDNNRGREAEFNAHIQYKCSLSWLDEMMTKGIWYGEIAIPFADLGVKSPSDGTLWNGNFCCNHYTGRKKDLQKSKYTMWANTKGHYLVPERFGEILFSRSGPAVNIKKLTELEEGNIGFSSLITNLGRRDKNIELKYLIYAREKNKIIFDEDIPFFLNPYASKPLKLSKQLIVRGENGLPVVFEYSLIDEKTKQTYYRNYHYFTCYPGFRLTLLPMFSQGKIYTRIDIRHLGGLPAKFNSRLEIINTNDSKKLIEQSIKGLSNKNRVVEVTTNISNLNPGDYQIKVILSANGKDISTSTASLTIPEKPPWLIERVGISDRVPPPWKPIKVIGNQINCLTQQYTFHNNNSFPSSIKILKEEILSAPIRIKAVIDGQQVKWGKPQIKLLFATDRIVRFRIENNSGNIILSGTVDIEFDGFVKVVWSVKTKRTIDYLGLEIPLKRENALYLRAKPTTAFPFDEKKKSILYKHLDARCIGGKGWKWNEGHLFELWVGDDERGFAWVTDSYENWYIKGNPIVVTNEGEFVKIQFNIIDNPTKINKALEYMMIVMATPARPRTPGWSKWHHLWNRIDIGAKIGANIITDGAHYAAWNTPETYPMPKLGTKTGNWALRQINLAHKYGMKYFLTTRTYCPGFETPAFKTYGAEWKVLPEHSFPLHGTFAGHVCAKTEFTDYLIWDMRRTVREFHNDGFYCDSSGPLPCANHYHDCGWWNEEKKKWEPTYNILGARELYKRFYQMLLDEGKTHPFLFHHHVPSYVLGHFVDFTTFGEFTQCWKISDKLHYPLFENKCALMRAWFVENQFGPVPRLYFSQAVKGLANIDPEELLTLTLLHNMDAEAISYELLQKIWKIRADFDIENSEWILYRKSAPYVNTDRKDILVSLYRKPDKVLLVIGNTGKQSYQGKIILNFKNLGWARKECWAIDKMTEKPQKVRIKNGNGVINIYVPGYHFRLIEVGLKNRDEDDEKI